MKRFINNVKKIRREVLKRVIPSFYYPEFVEIEGVKIPLRKAPYSFGIKRYLMKNNYENDEIILSKNLISTNDSCLEMGGSIGILTAVISNIVGPKGEIVSIEADPDLTSYSKQWLENQFRNITVLQGIALPIWDTNKQITIEFNKGNGSLGGNVRFIINDDLANGYSFFSLKKVWEITEKKFNTLIIDIEGSEAIFEHLMPNFPSSIKKIIIETHPNIYGEALQELVINKILDENFKIYEQIGNSYSLIREGEIN